MYGRRGFTKHVIEVLGPRLQRVSPDFYYGTVTAEELLKAVEKIPPANYGDRHNGAPRLRDFVEVAEQEPRALFEVYVVTELREDERLTVDGALVPLDRGDLIKHLLQKAKAFPDELDVIAENGVEYMRMWWD
jgi:hypothetical protein